MDKLLIISAIFGATGLYGLIIHLALVSNSTYGLINQYYGVWGSAMLIMTSIQCFYIQKKPTMFVTLNRSYYAETFYLSALVFVYFMTSIGLAVASKEDRGAAADQLGLS